MQILAKVSTGSRIFKSCLLLHSSSLTAKAPIRVSSRRISMETSNFTCDNKRGALIVLEGLDRSGKSSQCAKLESLLTSQGFLVEAWRFPDRTTDVGKMISAYLSSKADLDDRTIHLLFSANRWEKRSLMEAKLKGGTSLIVDRYSYSGVAFSAAKGLDLSWCKAPEVGLTAPDLVLYLDIPPEKAAERGGYGGERYELLDFQKKVAELYKALQDSTWKIVDASLPIDDVHEVLKELSLKAISDCQRGKEISLLWPS
uniref:Thymidylate kinase n=1 Tax=Araucaria cunninghamii TaxID=56994 RepID=A0A0D6QRZ2_ARACU